MTIMIRDALVENGAAILPGNEFTSILERFPSNLNKMSETLPLSEQAYLRKLTGRMRIADEPSGLTIVKLFIGSGRKEFEDLRR